MRVNEKENTDFIYYGTTELIGMHTKKPLILHESKAKYQAATIVTSKNVFPEYYMIYVEKFEDLINDAIDEWVYFFKHGAIREDFKSPGILLAAKKLDYLMLSEKERRGYDNYLAYLGQELGILDTAKEEGREEGRAEGRAEGVVIGEVRGKAETICQYLEARFGVESQALQETVRTITDFDVLSRIANRIFIVTQLDEATALIQVSSDRGQHSNRYNLI